MKRPGAALVALVIALGLPPSVLAQENDRSAERVGAALQRQSLLGSGALTWADPPPRKLGIFTLVPPEGPGEIVRLRLPIGELVSQAAHALSAAHQRRREASARHEVQRVLSAFIAQRKTR